ncbi:5-aminolevulinate synthase, erythroid-specific, mitochondrial [Eumeta japonica]|uniref:5-aminolevulinate synthase n=1 Tax=Eumeta variegata TaxID=151549 RepID=A0A4C1Z6S3_EUMVA|nr:5-aminolevulinate synthase, erythroid-specific, mitochondrial [Eumeta japonica]
MPCPFLGSLNQTFVRNYGATLLKQYGSYCPVVSRGFRTLGSDETKCPFIQNNGPIISEAPKEMTEDIHDVPVVAPYQYDNFFHDQITAKKNDYSYRVFKKVSRLAADGLYPWALEGSEHRKVVVWCSNDYLGASRHPFVKNAAISAIKSYGTGAGGTRNIAGNSQMTEKLEAEIAKIHKKPAALIFSSCFVANDATLSTLAKILPGCIVYSDAGNHASMIHGIRNSRAQKHIFRHNDPSHLKELLAASPTGVPKLVVFETVHSMSGAICPLEEMCNIAHEYGALTFVDEVHAVGLYGKHGAGIAEERGIQNSIDIVSGTLGKAFGSVGGYIAGSSLLVDTVRSLAPGFIFTTALPPPVLAASLAAIRLLAGEEGRALRAKHQAIVRYLKLSLLIAGLPQLPSVSHIVPVPIKGADKVAQVADSLMKRGHYVQSINHPTVARGEERLRFAPGPYHTPEMIDGLIAALIEAFHENNIPFNEFMKNGTCRECRMEYKMDISYSEESRWSPPLMGIHNARRVLGRNRISDEEENGVVEVGVDHRNSHALKERNIERRYFTSVFCESVASYQSRRLIVLLQPN